MTAEVESHTRAPVEVADETLLRRLREGESRAGEELVARHFPALMRYLQRLTGSDHLAEELHQQTWASVLEHLDRFDASPAGAAPNAATGGGFRPWLFRIATNKANDYWRSRKREDGAKSGMRLVVENLAPDASHRMAAGEQESKLRHAISLLSENQRQVLLLRYYGDMKFSEIARMLGCPLNTALGRMHKAMLRLKELMADD